jgi:hypothetical protein
MMVAVPAIDAPVALAAMVKTCRRESFSDAMICRPVV